MWRIPFEIRELQKTMTKQVQHINIKWNLNYAPVNILKPIQKTDTPSPSPPKKTPKKTHNVCLPFLLRSQGTVEYSCGTRYSPSNPGEAK